MYFNIKEKQLKIQYLIRSAYDSYSILNQIDEDEYVFIPTPGPFRIIGNDMEDIEAVDPSGGPIIYKGTNLFDFKIEKIYRTPEKIIIFKVKNNFD